MAIERNPLGCDMQPPATEAERQLLFNVLRAVVHSLGPIIGPDIELVVHDLAQPETSVVAIANGHISGRGVGSAIIGGPSGDEGLRLLLEEEELDAPVTVISDYRTTVPDGRVLDSLSVMFRGSDGRGMAGLCVNADRQHLRALRDLLNRHLDEPGRIGGAEPPAASGEESRPGVEDMARRIIEESLAATAADPANPSREERIRAVQAMQERGLFLIRQSADLAAERLGVTRYTIYNYLDLKSRR